jgi:hypothetical protein
MCFFRYATPSFAIAGSTIGASFFREMTTPDMSLLLVCGCPLPVFIQQVGELVFDPLFHDHALHCPFGSVPLTFVAHIWQHKV